jgi:cephalosporin-C deacetylase-like acetyl esterase
MARILIASCPLLLVFFAPLAAQDQAALERITAELKQISPHVAPESEREQLRTMLGRSLREQIVSANRASSEAWAQIQSRADWERFRQEKLAALRKALGPLPARPTPPRTLITGRVSGEGFQIQNLVYESRPGLVVTANLYIPDPPRDSMPGILLSHSHHNPKHEGELQDMGMTWARAGCYVLVPDHLGHGERRQHPFVTAADYAGQFQVGRQDYYFRYDTSLQLYLVGETLMGWLVHDLMTGVDQLLAQRGVDPRRIILLGSVAGGGDPAAVTAALDERIACACPFNFGGPQPESRYPLPADAETSFNYAGSGSWESTRDLYRSAADGFLPWTIVGSVAPRYLIHAHEFSWDRERDPVWKRYEKIWGFYDSSDRLAFAHGHGTLTGQAPPGSHCNNIGVVHRRQSHEAFRRWFHIDVKPEDEYKNRRTREELTCLTDEARRQFQPQPLHAILAAIADRQLAAAGHVRAAAKPEDRRRLLRESWARLLGNAEPPRQVTIRAGSPPIEQVGELTIRRELLDVEPGITVPLLVIVPGQENIRGGRALVVHLAPDGIAGMLRRNIGQIAVALHEGKAVAFVEPRGMGGSSPGADHGQQGAMTAHSATELMLARTLLAGQLRDVRSAWHHLAALQEIDRTRLCICGDSPIEPLPPTALFSYPRRIDNRPSECLPQAPLLALLCALFEDDVTSVEASGSLVAFRSVLDSPFVQVPHACIVPGLLREGDLADLTAALVPREVTLRGLVDGTGRAVSSSAARDAYAAAIRSYTSAALGHKLHFEEH